MSNHLQETIEIRPARPADEDALKRLAERDSAEIPPAPLLIAVQGGEVRAALSRANGRAIADPFAPSRRLVDILRIHGALAQPHVRVPAWPPPAGRPATA
jgi:hypothetical protein